MAASTDKPSKGLPTAQEVMEKLALAEAKKAEEESRKHAVAEAEKKQLLDNLTKPSGVSDEEALKRVAIIVERAVSNGLTEVQVYRFPNALCTDHGRATTGARLGGDADRPAEGDVRILGPTAAPARIQIKGPDHRLSRRHARRCRHHAEMGVSRAGRSSNQNFSLIQRRSLIVASSS